MESWPPWYGVRGPYFLLTFLLISPHPLICERGELCHLNEHKNLLHICQHVELVNYSFKLYCPSHSFYNLPHLTIVMNLVVFWIKVQKIQPMKTWGHHNVFDFNQSSKYPVDRWKSQIEFDMTYYLDEKGGVKWETLLKSFVQQQWNVLYFYFWRNHSHYRF